MTERKKPPFRADHVGSLLRPASLLAARKKFEDGDIRAAELRAAEDDAIRDVVRRQEDVGLQSITDNEFRRGSWHMDFLCTIGGIRAGGTQLRPFHNDCGEVRNEILIPEVYSKRHLDTPVFGDDFAFLSSVSTQTPKQSIPSPSILHSLGETERLGAYKDNDALLEDLRKVYVRHIEMMYELGCRYLQIDDTTFAMLGDPSYREKMRARTGGPEQSHITYINLINAIVKQKPADMVVCVHTCRGNHRSAWVASGGYDPVAEAVFSELEVDGLFLEYDDERSGGFEPLRFVPKGKFVVLGLVTSKRGELEKKDDLKRRIEAAARHVDVDQICLSPQCGFASTLEGNLVSEEQQFAKLRLIVETANEVWN
ncbi:5-methyltetrahydropteroyltriglutamate--homocystei ne S-methyltransferase [Mesorhizobium sp. L-8-10]|uniref:5-methyltetrahydropteroyltriglutamate-- homocysteine S-methyltransferase n=1 Tax=Mesorhizobium sp. L-8-10 TaxID=2744523 RepID=UPI0019258FE8|nr:5-methyltetrahydropteroyltriglutamate--homocysteine S-methyltransferase [Mesorhizobium sp. L-8-10]BCH35722.1 5-methyltetrahydropteroyltriglutamate--homocystei ne S-methyltransferase [Mesorhizobium sp. L-8-10]